MSRPVFESVFADEINQYLDSRTAAGFKEKSFMTHLRCFDSFCCERDLTQAVFTAADTEEWSRARPHEGTTSHYSRINGSKQFLTYLFLKGYDVHVPRDITFVPTDFQPHIYSDDEIERYFREVDAYFSIRNRKDAVQYPVLFRLLYCCGTRINETIGIRKQDVDLEDGIIKLFETKNNVERLLVLGHDLTMLMRSFAGKCFYLLCDGDYIFSNSKGGRLSGKLLYERHREFLRKAGIPFTGDGEGPRIHDWRHTMAVRSFKLMADAGLDMYVALPVLSAYLGHKTIYATERYVRLTMQLFPCIEEKFREKTDLVFGKAEIL